MHRCVVFLTLLVCAGSASAQDRDDRWRQDVRFLAEQVASRHPDFFTQTSRDDFRAAAERLITRVPELTDVQVVLEMTRLTAMGGDAHTVLSTTQGGTGLRFFPIRLGWFADGLFVTQAPTEHVTAIGRKVVRVGDRSVEEAMDLLKPFISHENAGWLRQSSHALLVSPEALHWAGVVTELGRASYTLESGETIEVSTASGAMMAPQRARPVNPLWQRNASQNYWFHYLENERVLYVKYNVCRESPALPLRTMAAELTALFNSSPVDQMIVDIRNNTGGDSSVFLNLIRQVTAPQLERLVAERRFSAIIGNQTFSSGMRTAMVIKSMGGKLIGEPTGGRPSWFTEVLGFTLPNSRIAVQYSTRKDDDTVFKGMSVEPDVSVAFNGSDFFTERDPFLEAALTR